MCNLDGKLRELPQFCRVANGFLRNSTIRHLSMLSRSHQLILASIRVINFEEDFSLGVDNTEHLAILKNPMSAEHLFAADFSQRLPNGNHSLYCLRCPYTNRLRDFNHMLVELKCFQGVLKSDFIHVWTSNAA